MKFKTRRSLTTLLATFAIMAFSSCNRGYGCPTNFSWEDSWSILSDMLTNLL